MKKIEFVANKSDRLLKVCADAYPTIKYFAFEKMLRQKDIRVNGEKQNENISIETGDEIAFFVQDEVLEGNKRFSVFFEDDNVLIVNKAKGIEVCDGEFNVCDELAKSKIKVFPVHRIDRNTEGLVVFAKTALCKNILLEAFEQNKIKKYYIAEVIGSPKQDEKTLSAYLTKNKEDSYVKIYNSPVANSDKITTNYKVIKRGNQTSLLEVEIPTGKTHQIRAHLAYVGYPIIGDGKYGKNEDNKKFRESTQKLVAYKLKFMLDEDSILSYLNEKSFIISAFGLDIKQD